MDDATLYDWALEKEKPPTYEEVIEQFAKGVEKACRAVGIADWSEIQSHKVGFVVLGGFVGVCFMGFFSGQYECPCDQNCSIVS